MMPGVQPFLKRFQAKLPAVALTPVQHQDTLTARTSLP